MKEIYKVSIYQSCLVIATNSPKALFFFGVVYGYSNTGQNNEKKTNGILFFSAYMASKNIEQLYICFI